MNRASFVLANMLLAVYIVAPALSETAAADGKVAQCAQSFSTSQWKESCYESDKKFRLLATFLRQYDLIGMNQAQVVELLGDARSDLRISNSCVGAVWLEIEYEKGKVSRWRMRDWDGCNGIAHHEQPWIEENVVMTLGEPVYPPKFSSKYERSQSVQIAEHEQIRR
jgi:hypothetical protein